MTIAQIQQMNFNSQPHKEADTFYFYFVSMPSRISTHSLTRRLTADIGA